MLISASVKSYNDSSGEEYLASEDLTAFFSPAQGHQGNCVNGPLSSFPKRVIGTLAAEALPIAGTKREEARFSIHLVHNYKNIPFF